MEGPHHPGQCYRGDDSGHARMSDRPHRPRGGAPWSPPCRDGVARLGRLHRRCLPRGRQRPQPKTEAVTPGVASGTPHPRGTPIHQQQHRPIPGEVQPSGTTYRPSPSRRRSTFPTLQLVQPLCGQPDAPAGPQRVPGQLQDLVHRQPALPGNPQDPRRHGLQTHSRAM